MIVKAKQKKEKQLLATRRTVLAKLYHKDVQERQGSWSPGSSFARSLAGRSTGTKTDRTIRLGNSHIKHTTRTQCDRRSCGRLGAVRRHWRASCATWCDTRNSLPMITSQRCFWCKFVLRMTRYGADRDVFVVMCADGREPAETLSERCALGSRGARAHMSVVERGKKCLAESKTTKI